MRSVTVAMALACLLTVAEARAIPSMVKVFLTCPVCGHEVVGWVGGGDHDGPTTSDDQLLYEVQDLLTCRSCGFTGDPDQYRSDDLDRGKLRKALAALPKYSDSPDMDRAAAVERVWENRPERLAAIAIRARWESDGAENERRRVSDALEAVQAALEAGAYEEPDDDDGPPRLQFAAMCYVGEAMVTLDRPKQAFAALTQALKLRDEVLAKPDVNVWDRDTFQAIGRNAEKVLFRVRLAGQSAREIYATGMDGSDDQKLWARDLLLERDRELALSLAAEIAEHVPRVGRENIAKGWDWASPQAEAIARAGLASSNSDRRYHAMCILAKRRPDEVLGLVRQTLKRDPAARIHAVVEALVTTQPDQVRTLLREYVNKHGQEADLGLCQLLADHAAPEDADLVADLRSRRLVRASPREELLGLLDGRSVGSLPRIVLLLGEGAGQTWRGHCGGQYGNASESAPEALERRAWLLKAVEFGRPLLGALPNLDHADQSDQAAEAKMWILMARGTADDLAVLRRTLKRKDRLAELAAQLLVYRRDPAGKRYLLEAQSVEDTHEGLRDPRCEVSGEFLRALRDSLCASDFPLLWQQYRLRLAFQDGQIRIARLALREIPKVDLPDPDEPEMPMAHWDALPEDRKELITLRWQNADGLLDRYWRAWRLLNRMRRQRNDVTEAYLPLLAATRHPMARSYVLGMLDSPDPDLVATAQYALQVNWDTTIAESLLGRFPTATTDERKVILDLLVQAGDQEHLNGLLAMQKAEGFWYVRMDWAETMWALHGQKVLPIVKTWADAGDRDAVRWMWKHEGVEDPPAKGE